MTKVKLLAQGEGLDNHRELKKIERKCWIQKQKQHDINLIDMTEVEISTIEIGKNMGIFYRKLCKHVPLQDLISTLYTR